MCDNPLDASTATAGGIPMATPADIRFGTDGWRAVIGADFTYESLAPRRRRGRSCLLGGQPRRACARRLRHALRGRQLRRRRSGGACEPRAAGEGVRQLPAHARAVLVGRGRRRCGRRRDAHGEPQPQRVPGLQAAHGRRRRVPGRVHPARRGGAARRRRLPAAASSRLVDLAGPYLATLRSKVDEDAIRSANLRVVVDPLYGAGQTYLAETLRSFGVEVLEIHAERNPGFGGLHPEPIPPWIDEAAAAVREGGYDAAFVTDGDADRIGAIDSTGAFVSPHRIIALVARHLVEDKGETGKVVKTLSTSVIVDRLASRLGLEVVTTPVGFKWIYEEMVKGGVLIGGEESGGIGIPSHVRERDGLLMSLMLAEMMAQRKMGLGELVEDLFALTGPMEYGRVDLRLTPQAKDDFVARMPSMEPAELGGVGVHEIVRTDGIKFLLDDDAWLLLRTSGTEPLVRVYAEASSAGVVDDLLAAGRDCSPRVGDEYRPRTARHHGQQVLPAPRGRRGVPCPRSL